MPEKKTLMLNKFNNDEFQNANGQRNNDIPLFL